MGLSQRSPTFLTPGTGFTEDNFSMDWGWGMVQEVMRVMGSDGERWGTADEASLASPPLTSCCVAWFLTGCGLVLVHGPGTGEP